MGRLLVASVILVGCGDGKPTPESVATGGKDGQHVDVTGEVHTVTWDSTMVAMRGVAHSEDFDAPGAIYPRTGDHYILIRSKKPPGITNGDPDFSIGNLVPAWGLGIHLTDIDPATPMPEVGAVVHVTGTFRRITWNGRDQQLPILDDATIDVISGPDPLGGPGDACTVDQACNARLVCDRATQKCTPPPHEIYWDDPWRDVNGACTADTDCPLGQHCKLDYTISATGAFPVHYLTAQDTGKHLCVLDAGTTIASTCPRIYTIRDLAGARFATGKEICIRITMLQPVPAADGDTHDQVIVDEPLPYPEADGPYNLFGGVTENGPMYKDPALGTSMVADPQPNAELIAVGTFRYDDGHGWHEMHPVKAYFPAP